MLKRLAIGILIVLLTGCGPFGYLYKVTNQATRLLADAKTAGAEKLAPYEYWSAVQYLKMAREKAGDADFEIAYDYGDRAVKMSKKAKRLAAERAQAGPSAAPPEPKPKVVLPDGDSN